MPDPVLAADRDGRRARLVLAGELDMGARFQAEQALDKLLAAPVEHLVVDLGVINANLEQEPVELGFGKRIRAFKLDRILRREDGKEPRQLVALSIDRDLVFFHAFQQSRLRPWRHAIDFIDEQQIREHRSLVKLECARRHVQDVGADDIRGHQIRRTLNPLKIQPNQP